MALPDYKNWTQENAYIDQPKKGRQRRKDRGAFNCVEEIKLEETNV
jgi:hypothetical protein